MPALSVLFVAFWAQPKSRSSFNAYELLDFNLISPLMRFLTSATRPQVALVTCQFQCLFLLLVVLYAGSVVIDLPATIAWRRSTTTREAWRSTKSWRASIARGATCRRVTSCKTLASTILDCSGKRTWSSGWATTSWEARRSSEASRCAREATCESRTRSSNTRSRSSQANG